MAEQKGLQRWPRLGRSHRKLYCLGANRSDRVSPTSFSSCSHAPAAATPNAALCFRIPLLGCRSMTCRRASRDMYGRHIGKRARLQKGLFACPSVYSTSKQNASHPTELHMCQATSLLPSLPRSHFLSGEDSLMTPPHPGYAVQKPAVGRRAVHNGPSGAPARRMIAVSSIAAVTVGFAAWAYATTKSQPQPEFGIVNATSLPPQAVVVEPRSFAVLGNNGAFRQSAFTEFLNPTNTSPPFFQVFDPAFLQILGPSATIRAVAANPTFAFAHEAPIWVPSTDEVFFASNDGGEFGMSDIDHNNQVSRISLKEVQAAINAAGRNPTAVNVSVTKLDLPDTIQMTNGGTGPFFGNLILVNSGRGPLPPSIALVNPAAPHNTTILLDNFFGRQFNSLNDAKIRPGTSTLFFTDVTYGFLNHFRPEPLMPNQVYRLDPETRTVRVVADGFDRCNGIAFSRDGKTAFVSDTGANAGFLGNNQTQPATVYAFDVDPKTEAFNNRRVFAYVDTGIPDGMQLDAEDNLYAGCGDGVHVWNSKGTLLGKFFLGTTSANLVFAGDKRLVIMAETAIYFAEIAAKANKLSFP